MGLENLQLLLSFLFHQSFISRRYFRQNLHKSRIFFNYDENAKDSKLKEIDLKQYGDKKISSFPSTNGMLNFVVDSTNHISRNSTSSYI